uniref:Uncharacterized protein n=1 Tax=Meloidogyne javanica TaxID=6303 RepID=A0A915M0A1_MELJA
MILSYFYLWSPWGLAADRQFGLAEGSANSYIFVKYHKKWAELTYLEKKKFELETCKNDKDVKCIYRTHDYPLCSHDFKPYDKGMER